MPTGYFNWMSDSNNQLTRDRLNVILRHAMNDQDEVLYRDLCKPCIILSSVHMCLALKLCPSGLNFLFSMPYVTLYHYCRRVFAGFRC